ncbi:MAG: hypothetical protein BWK73_05545 [Thiothrix lacustris]|uniref:Type III secretion protein n=1 Tax=Thiothrix lacustris TaxID=525917 RepID=A0A1Y1QXQ5_9GAMM|nr:MAG: hypothetical protein BWK73_05545 [Thiothrix lacustris]
MFDVAAMVSPAAIKYQDIQQSLPAVSMNDAFRLENIIKSKYENIDAELNFNAFDASKRDNSILQIEEPVTTDSFDFKQLIVDNAVDMDQSYHSIMSQFSNLPSFNDMLIDVRRTNNADQMRTYPLVNENSPVDNAIKAIQASAQNSMQTMQASTNHAHVMTKWSIGSQLWMGKMNLVTAAVSQVSQGFKTLFQAG